MFVVYILQSLKDGRTYVGFSDDMEKRLHEYSSGCVDATKNRRPFRVLFTESVPDLATAKGRELYWKSGAGRRKLKLYFQTGFPPQ